MSAADFSNPCLIALVFFYSLNLAPMMFETFTSDRIWASHPPASFAMFLGPYGQRTTHYWRIVSPLATAAFVASLVFTWDAPARLAWLAAGFALYVAIQAATMAYFVPEQEGLIGHVRSLSGDVLTSRAHRWMFWNYFRNAAGVLAFVCLMNAILAGAR